MRPRRPQPPRAPAPEQPRIHHPRSAPSTPRLLAAARALSMVGVAFSSVGGEKRNLSHSNSTFSLLTPLVDILQLYPHFSPSSSIAISPSFHSALLLSHSPFHSATHFFRILPIFSSSFIIHPRLPIFIPLARPLYLFPPPHTPNRFLTFHSFGSRYPVVFAALGHEEDRTNINRSK